MQKEKGDAVDLKKGTEIVEESGVDLRPEIEKGETGVRSFGLFIDDCVLTRVHENNRISSEPL